MNEEPEQLWDVAIYEIATGQIHSIVGERMRRWDGEGTGRNTAELCQQTAMERCNERYSAAILPAGRYTKNATISKADLQP